MVALQPLVIGEDFGRRQKKCRAAQRAVAHIRCEQHRRQADPIRAESLAKLPVAGKLVRCYQEVAAFRLQLLDLRVHAPRQFQVAGGKRNDDSLRVFRKHPEDELLKRRLQWNSMAVASPAVLSLAFGLALYCTDTVRGDFCTPQASDCSPPPATVIFEGSPTRSWTVLPSDVWITSLACPPTQSRRDSTPSTVASE